MTANERGSALLVLNESDRRLGALVRSRMPDNGLAVLLRDSGLTAEDADTVLFEFSSSPRIAAAMWALREWLVREGRP